MWAGRPHYSSLMRRQVAKKPWGGPSSHLIIAYCTHRPERQKGRPTTPVCVWKRKRQSFRPGCSFHLSQWFAAEIQRAGKAKWQFQSIWIRNNQRLVTADEFFISFSLGYHPWNNEFFNQNYAMRPTDCRAFSFNHKWRKQMIDDVFGWPCGPHWPQQLLLFNWTEANFTPKHFEQKLAW